MNIGDRIRCKREALGMSQEELAFKLGYKSRSSINKIEKDASGLPQKKIADIAKALGTTPSYIMGWDDEMKKNPMQLAERHFELLMNEDLQDIFDDFQKLSAEGRKMAKKIIHSLVDEGI